jgi:hypothetical protein
MTGANLPALTGQLKTCGMDDAAVGRVFATFNVAAFEQRNNHDASQ